MIFNLVQIVQKNIQLLLTAPINLPKNNIWHINFILPQDLNDEPTRVLLELIRAEKEELIKQGKIKRDRKESVFFRGEDNSYYRKFLYKKI